MLLSRDELVSALFRETDRAQRMKTPLSVIEFGIDDSERSRNQLGTELFREAVREIVERITRLSRSYDFMGALSEDTFLVALPGCESSNAMMLAERLGITYSDLLSGSGAMRSLSVPVSELRRAEAALRLW
jgi:two-component system, cell cycle response regulator